MHALYVLVPALGILAIAYRYYSAFLASKVYALDDSRKTPAHTKYDGSNYYPTSRWVLFGHHFAAITGSGPLVGPMLAVAVRLRARAICGWWPASVSPAPFTIRSSCGRRCAAAGARCRTSSRQEIGSVAGLVAAIAILFIIIITLAGLGIILVNALSDSPWGVFTIAVTIPLGILMGFWMYVWRKGKMTEATIIGVIGLLLAVVGGEPLNHPDSWLGSVLPAVANRAGRLRSASTPSIASVLPVWLLLSPRGYLSSFTKIGTIVLLAFGVIVVNPQFQMPALTEFVGGGGPIIPGPLFPFCFITIACGAISGFHGLISSGHDVEDGGQGIGHSTGRLRRDARRVLRRHHGVDCRRVAAARRLLRHERDTGRIREADVRRTVLAGRSTSRRSRPPSGKSSPVEPVAPSRWRSAWRRFFRPCPG